MEFVFSLNDEVVSKRSLSAKSRWNSRSNEQVFDFDIMASDFDTVKVTQSGTDGINFEIFKIECGTGESLDFVKLGGCEGSLWFDRKNGPNTDNCYHETATQVKEATFKEPETG